MNNIKEIFKDLLHYAPAKIVPSIVNFTSVIIFTWIINPSEYGDYILVLSTITIVSNLTVSWISQANVRLFAKYSSFEIRRAFISTFVIFFGIINILFTILWFVVVLVLKNEINYNIYILLQIATIYLFFENTFLFTSGYLRAERRSKTYRNQQLIKNIAGITTSIIIMLLFKVGIEIVFIISSIFSCIFVFRILISINDEWNIKLKYFSTSLLKSSLSYGLPLSLTALAGYGISLSDRYFIKFYFGSSAVGLYSVGYRLSEVSILLFSGILIFAAFPVIIKTFETAGALKAQEIITYLTRVYFVTMIPILLVMIFLAKDIVSLFLDEQYTETYKIIPWIVSGAFLSGITQYINKSFELYEKTKYLLYLLLASSIITILMNILLIPTYGYLGAAIATLIGYTLYILLSIYFSAKILKWIIPWDTIIKILISTIPMILFLSYVFRIVNIDIINLLIKIIIVSVIYFLSLTFLKERIISDMILQLQYLRRKF